METQGNGATTISPGVTSQANNIVSISEARERRSNTHESVSAAENADVTLLKDNVIKFPIRRDEAGIADNLVKIAKEDGVDEALAEIAGQKDGDEGELSPEGQNITEEKTELFNTVEFLKQRVELLANKNNELKGRVTEIEKNKVKTGEALNQVARALIIIIENEEDEEKKKNLLAQLATLIATILTLITVGEQEQKEEEPQSAPSGKKITVIMPGEEDLPEENVIENQAA